MNKNISKGMKFCLLLCCALFSASTVSAQIFPGGGFSIVDGGGRVASACSTVAVSGITTNRNVRSVSFNGSHTWIGDTEIRVYPPAAAPPPSTTGSVVISSPPDGRGCNYNGTYTFTDTAAQSIDAATVGCGDATNIPDNVPYRTNTYGGGTNPGPVTSLTTTFGLLTPAQANGNWLVCIFDFATPDTGAVTATSIQFAVPTAAGVNIGGRVLNATGMGISKSSVTITDAQGNARTTLTNPFGYYNFEDVAAGTSVTLSVSAKGRTFANPTIIHSVGDAVDSLNFTSLD